MIEPLEIERRPLGTSGFTIPRIALGCGNFGGIGSALDLIGRGLNEEEADAVMDAAWEMGITHFDTADAYAGGHSEQIIGRWIASRRVRPSLTTKTFHPIFPGADQGLSPARIEKRLPASLKRLGVPHIELYLVHDYDPVVPLSETFGALQRFQDARKITGYGVSNFNILQLLEAVSAGRPVAIQNGYSLLEQGYEDEMLQECADRGMAYIVFSPLAGGWLTGKYRRGERYPFGSRMTQRPGPYEYLVTENTFAKLDALRGFADERGSSMAAVALGWVLADDRVSQVVIGPGRPEHLEPLREALTNPITLEERQQLGAIF